METLKFIGQTATTASILILAVSVLLQVRLYRLLRKRIEHLEMLVYWQGGRPRE